MSEVKIESVHDVLVSLIYIRNGISAIIFSNDRNDVSVMVIDMIDWRVKNALCQCSIYIKGDFYKTTITASELYNNLITLERDLIIDQIII